MSTEKILIVGGYGEVGRRLAAQLEATEPNRVILGGRHPEQAGGILGLQQAGRLIDVNDPASVDQALDGIGVVIACVRQSKPHLLRAAVRRGIAYTSIAPPWMLLPETQLLRNEAERTGARIVLAAGLEPGITSVLVRAAADRLAQQQQQQQQHHHHQKQKRQIDIDAVETALLLSLGDAYGPDSMGFILEEVTQPYSITINGKAQSSNAFEQPKRVAFPAPIGMRRAYTMPFRDQLYYPTTMGAKTAVARIALDPPWLADGLSVLLRLGLRHALQKNGARKTTRDWIEKLRGRYVGRDHYALVVDVRAGDRMIRWTLVGRQQATATAVGVGAVAEALWSREVDAAGVWLAEQVIAPAPFLARLAAQGIVPRSEELTTISPSVRDAPKSRNKNPAPDEEAITNA